MAKQDKEKGKCDACGKDPRVLTAIGSGQRVCRTCLRELRPVEPKRPRAKVKTKAKGKVKAKARPPSCRHFFTKVVGVTKRNPNGSDRQKLIRKCQQRGKRFEQLELDHEEDNPVDPNAVAVSRANGDQLGYLNADLAAEVVGKSAKGYRYAAYVSDIRGDKILGVNVLLVVGTPGTTDAQAQKLAFVTRDDGPEWTLQLRPPLDASDSPESVETVATILSDGLKAEQLSLLVPEGS